MRVLADRVIVEPEEMPEKMGNILLPDQARQNTLRGTVIAVGPGRTTDDGRVLPVAVKVGDVVFYGWGGNELAVNGKKYLSLRESDLLAVVEG